MSYKRDHAQGQADAQRDLERGEMIFKTAGRQACWAAQWNRILQERYGVKLVWGVGCTGSEDEFDYIRGYNEIASQAIMQRYGSDIVKATNEEAMKVYEVESANESQEPTMESPVDQFGRVVCAYCGRAFQVSDAERWDGQRHRECGYSLRLYDVGAKSAI